MLWYGPLRCRASSRLTTGAEKLHRARRHQPALNRSHELSTSKFVVFSVIRYAVLQLNEMDSVFQTSFREQYPTP